MTFTLVYCCLLEHTSNQVHTYLQVLDILFVGSNDLASSMGLFACDHSNFPEVQAAAARVREAAHKHMKFSGHFCASGETT